MLSIQIRIAREGSAYFCYNTLLYYLCSVILFGIYTFIYK